MRKIREILRLKWTTQLSNREIAKNCSTARSTVAGRLERASNAGLSWPLPDHLDDTALEHLLYNSVRTGALIIPGISITPGATKILAFIQTNDAYTQASMNISPQRTPQIDVWTVQEKESSVARALESLGIEPVPMKKTSGKVGKIPLQSFDRATFVAFLQAMGQA